MIFKDVPTIEMDADESYYFLALCLGCSLSCPSCCFPELVMLEDVNGVDGKTVVEYLIEPRFTDHIIIGGGEPTEQADLCDFLEDIRSPGLSIELRTNGVNPAILKECLDRKLVNKYSISYKAPFTKYLSATGHRPVGMKVIESMKLMINSGADFEIVTYAHKRMHADGDFAGMRDELDDIGVTEWKIIPFCCPNPLDPSMAPSRAYTFEELQDIASQLPDVIVEL